MDVLNGIAQFQSETEELASDDIKDKDEVFCAEVIYNYLFVI